MIPILPIATRFSDFFEIRYDPKVIWLSPIGNQAWAETSSGTLPFEVITVSESRRDYLIFFQIPYDPKVIWLSPMGNRAGAVTCFSQ
jgi:hypothetical protein